jgi:hypothetical protein
VILGLLAFTVIGIGFAVQGFRMLRDRDYGEHFVEDTIPKVFRMGSPNTHRKILGGGWLVLGTLFACLGVAFMASHL